MVLGTCLMGLTGIAVLSIAGTAPHRQERSASSLHAIHADVAHLSAQEGAARPRTVVRPISSHELTTLPGQHMSTVVVEFPPGGFSPRHVHGGSVYVYVLSGTIRSQLEGGPPGYYKTGDTFFEPQGIVHVLAENFSMTEPATILAVFVHEAGATLTTYLE